MKQERSKVKSDILLRVRLLYVLFILAGAIVLARLVWVQLFSAEVAYNADRLASRIFTEEVIPAQRGSILSRDGEPLATSIFRYQAAFDFASPGLDSLKTFREQADSLAKLLAAFFRDKPASAYAKRFREEHARRYRLVNPRDTSYLRSEGWISRMMDRMRGEEYVKRRIYDTIRDHTPVNIFPREVDFAEWETLRRYPLLNWNMGMVYRLIRYDRSELAPISIADGSGRQKQYGIEAYARMAGATLKPCASHIPRAAGIGEARPRGDQWTASASSSTAPETLDLPGSSGQNSRGVGERPAGKPKNASGRGHGEPIVDVGGVHAGRNPASDGQRPMPTGVSPNGDYALGRSMEPGATFKRRCSRCSTTPGCPSRRFYDTNGDPMTVGRPGTSAIRTAATVKIDFGAADITFAKGDLGPLSTGEYSDFSRLHQTRPLGLEQKLGERKPSRHHGLEGSRLPGRAGRRCPAVIVCGWPRSDDHLLQRHCQRREDDFAPCWCELRRSDRSRERSKAVPSPRRSPRGRRCAKCSSVCRRCCTEGTASAFSATRRCCGRRPKTIGADLMPATAGRYWVRCGGGPRPRPTAPHFTRVAHTTIETRAQAGKAYHRGTAGGSVVAWSFHRWPQTAVQMAVSTTEVAPLSPTEDEGRRHRRVAATCRPPRSKAARAGGASRWTTSRTSSSQPARRPGRDTRPCAACGVERRAVRARKPRTERSATRTGSRNAAKVSPPERIAPGTAVVITLK